MSLSRQKQPVLKPQDLLVAMKIAVKEGGPITFSELGIELSMSASEAHAAAQRAEISRLITREHGQLFAIRSSLLEFILHGVKYSFPPLLGSVARGMATSIAAPPLRKYFGPSEILNFVWPDSRGEDRGLSLLPLYPSVPAAARIDPELYELLVLVDAIRSGAAREREIASSELAERLA